MTAYETELAAFRTARAAALRQEDGWLNITDRVEFGQGRHSLGAGAQNALVLSVGPDMLGEVCFEGETLRFFDASGAELALSETVPPRLRLEGLLLEFTALEGHHAVRVRQIDHPRRADFVMPQWYAPALEWRIEADWVALDEPIVQEIETVAGILTKSVMTHKAVFMHEGEIVSLFATHGTAEKPMFVLRDQTARDTTYPAARFLYGALDGEGKIVLDFNRAITPPCGFTDFATCPLPPPSNHLPFRIEAGEKRP